ncbi:hypothetical protein JCM5353_008110 [Sporobolomyces roseus]
MSIDPPEDPLSTLSTQLLSHGYITRPLSLSSLFLTPPLPSSSSSSSSLKSHQSLLLSKARAQDQLTKLIWSLLERGLEGREELRECVEREGRLNSEWERERGLRERSERDLKKVERELEVERARSKELEGLLKGEKERGKLARDDANKTRNALGFIRTQSIHDQKKRDQELTSLHSRLSKLTTDSTQPKFKLLNPSTTSSPTNGQRRSPISTPTASNEFGQLEAELRLVKSAMEELEVVREELSRENRELRGFVGELGEWVEKLLCEGEKGLNLLQDTSDEDVQQGEEDEMDRDKREAIELLKKLKNSSDESNDQTNEDTSFSIPTPHLSLPASSLLPQLHEKLYALRLTLLVSLRSVQGRIERERQLGQENVEREIEARDQEIEEREKIQKELEETRARLEQGNQLVEQFMLANVGKQPRPSKLIGRDDSGDELPVEIAKELEKTKQQAKKSSLKLYNAAIDKPTSSSNKLPPPPPRISEPPSKSVLDFLGSLGLDTPVLSGKDALRSEKIPLPKPSRSSSGESGELVRGRRVSGEKEKEREGEFKKPSGLRKKPSTSQLKPSPTITTTSSSSTSSLPPAPPTITTSSTISSILSLSLSPPTSNQTPPLISPKLLVGDKKVLGDSRIVNEGGEKKSREELVREKKESLIRKGKGRERG